MLNKVDTKRFYKSIVYLEGNISTICQEAIKKYYLNYSKHVSRHKNNFSFRFRMHAQNRKYFQK